jgi:hypothetical protein
MPSGGQRACNPSVRTPGVPADISLNDYAILADFLKKAATRYGDPVAYHSLGVEIQPPSARRVSQTSGGLFPAGFATAA